VNAHFSLATGRLARGMFRRSLAVVRERCEFTIDLNSLTFEHDSPLVAPQRKATTIPRTRLFSIAFLHITAKQSLSFYHLC
jgi:hypothetical protein